MFHDNSNNAEKMENFAKLKIHFLSLLVYHYARKIKVPLSFPILSARFRSASTSSPSTLPNFARRIGFSSSPSVSSSISCALSAKFSPPHSKDPKVSSHVRIYRFKPVDNTSRETNHHCCQYKRSNPTLLPALHPPHHGVRLWGYDHLLVRSWRRIGGNSWFCRRIRGILYFEWWIISWYAGGWCPFIDYSLPGGTRSGLGQDIPLQPNFLSNTCLQFICYQLSMLIWTGWMQLVQAGKEEPGCTEDKPQDWTKQSLHSS